MWPQRTKAILLGASSWRRSTFIFPARTVQRSGNWPWLARSSRSKSFESKAAVIRKTTIPGGGRVQVIAIKAAAAN